MANLILKSRHSGSLINIKDEIITGLLGGTFYALVCYSMDDYMISEIEHVIDNYYFNVLHKKESRIIPFLSGAKPELYQKIQYF